MQFIDLGQQYKAYQEDIDRSIQSVLDQSNFILGESVNQIEQKLAHFVGVKHGIGVSSGTDALLLSLAAIGVNQGSEVITTPFSFIASVEVLLWLGATPVFVDIKPDTFLMNVNEIEKKINSKTRAILPVSLYGHMPDIQAVCQIADQYGLSVIEDGAQSFGATSPYGRSGGVTTLGCTSFFPAKPLGCYGDGGMIFTNDDELSQALREMRIHGQSEKYKHVRLGLNGRLDTLQAAILLAKFSHFESEIRKRKEAGDYYINALESLQDVTPPKVLSGYTHVFGQFTIRVPNREQVRQTLGELGIPTAVHYPVPLHRQPLIESLKLSGTFPHAEEASDQVLSLPFHPFISRSEQDQVIESLKKALTA